jgi:membrane-associated phospholipid phosphatase
VRAAALLLVLGTGIPTPALGQSSFDLDRAPHGLLAGGLWVSALTLDSKKNSWTGMSPCAGAAREPQPWELRAREESDPGLCDRRRINAVDRALLVPRWSAAARLSDLLLLSTMVAPLGVAGATAIDASQGGAQFGDDAVVIVQTLGATYLATVVLKFVVRRPRPLTYDASFSKEERFEGDARLSFPSGHASLAFAGASLVAVLVADRIDRSGPRIAAIAGAYAGAGLVGYLRMAGRRHFFTDVLVGAGLGTAMGWLIPEAHRASSEGTTGEDASGRFMVGWSGSF